MTSHKFKVGDQVRLVRLASTNTVEAFLNMVSATDPTKLDETWEITRLLPEDSSGFQYHIRGAQAGPGRLVREEQLQAA
ncbi:hypothetical protein [Microvirga zambiensis]|uniref:hypothetical protein n=1 Tax=Microvirga zambiensis TaxID=1402137 RepID=UPI00191CC8F6|nr:hypothetical protein [Microvirga zambiensis]